MTNVFASEEFFCRLFFFYRRVIFTDEYSKIVHKRQHLVFSNLKISLVYLVYWALKLIKTFKLVNNVRD